MSKAIAAGQIVPIDHPINNKISTDWVNITPAIAEKWLGQNHDNRNRRPAVIRAYARDMRNGQWRTTGEAIKFDYNGTLIDGQHRLEAVLESGATIRMLVVKGLDPVAKQVLDTGAKRSQADALKFAGFGGATNITASVARIAIAREQGFIKTAFGSAPTVTNSETIAWVADHPDVESAVALALRTSRRIGINPSPWAYALYEMERVNALLAHEFALSMHEMRGLNGPGDPRVTMMNTFASAGRNERRKPGTGETIFIAFRTWNAWVEGKRLAKLYTQRAMPGEDRVNAKGAPIPALKEPTTAVRERYYA